MPVTLNASTSSGLIATSDTSGNIELQNNGTTRMTVSSAGVSFAAQPLIGGVAPPAFSAYLGTAQTITNNVETKIQFNTELFDTNNNYDPTTNYRFTPTVAGYYQINVTVDNGINTSTGIFYVKIFKNSSSYLEICRMQNQPNTTLKLSGSTVVFLNGSTDNIEVYLFQNSGGNATVPASVNTQISGCLVRGS